VKPGPRAKLLALIGLFLLPILASLFTYYVVRPGANANYGELIAPQPARLSQLRILSQAPLDAGALQEKWVMVTAEASSCPAGCAQKLATMSVVRLALGRNASRVGRMVVVDGGLPAASGPTEGFVVGRVADKPSPSSGAAADLRRDATHIYLVDPRGDVMLRWPAAPDRKRMLKDLERLLRASQIG
jgi:cytochrome oxidase Cu insertion factor (SCO1/SenC/PrrC family)